MPTQRQHIYRSFPPPPPCLSSQSSPIMGSRTRWRIRREEAQVSPGRWCRHRDSTHCGEEWDIFRPHMKGPPNFLASIYPWSNSGVTVSGPLCHFLLWGLGVSKHSIVQAVNNCKNRAVQCEMWAIQYTLCILYYTVYTVYNIYCRVFSIELAVFSDIVHSTMYIERSV